VWRHLVPWHTVLPAQPSGANDWVSSKSHETLMPTELHKLCPYLCLQSKPVGMCDV
jgi:hypothetical protein